MKTNHRILSFFGVTVIALAGFAALSAILIGGVTWLGLPLGLDLPLPPQTLVVGGMFLAVPIAMTGWGMIWLAQWLKDH